MVAIIPYRPAGPRGGAVSGIQRDGEGEPRCDVIAPQAHINPADFMLQ